MRACGNAHGGTAADTVRSRWYGREQLGAAEARATSRSQKDAD
jgi:hypothetical protein